MLVKFSTLRGGVFIEVGEGERYHAEARCFRFDKDGNAEYAILHDLVSTNPSPRWFAHCYKPSQFTFA
jgi:hypothetical protein